jgi:hypothetical protein
MKTFLETETGRVCVLGLFTSVGIGLYCFTKDKYLVELFAGALLLAMNTGKSKSQE